MKPLVPYTKIPNSVLHDGSLSPSAKVLHFILINHARNNMVCWPTQETLAKSVGVSSRQIKNIIKELKKRSLVKVEKVSGRRNNHYVPLVTIEGNSTSPHTGTTFHQLVPSVGNLLPTNSNSSRKIEKKGGLLAIGEIVQTQYQKYNKEQK